MSEGFVWFDYVTSDVAKAQTYFCALFGWTTIEASQGGYTMIANRGRPIGGYQDAAKLHGAHMQGAHAHWISFLQIANMSESVAKLTASGGTVEKPPFVVGEQGTEALVRDPLGGGFALWEPAKGMAATGDYAGVEGAWVWNELYTQDPDASLAFYQAIGGFTHSTMKTPGGQPGPARYDILEANGKGRAGIMKLPNLPQMWMPYVQVADVDAIVAKAKELGATSPMPAETVPGVGRIAALMDPFGGAIGVLHPMPA